MKIPIHQNVVVLLAACLLGSETFAEPSDVSFNRDIRPLLAAKCFACHGPDDESRAADLRLDRREDAVETGALVAGDASDSEVLRRIRSSDPDERMPPLEAGEAMSPEQAKLIEQWIDGGAEYEEHWAFVHPVRSELPEVKKSDWPANPIDYFALARMESEGLLPAPVAEPYTLVRRLYLDLIGIPPTPREADAFAQDPSEEAYGRLVDKLLNSAHYGQRWARPWLDLARYSDTNGYEKDRGRSIWPYRDWVIRALNEDMPFDRFSIEQIAGDMLPNATEAQRIATGFHRNTMLNEEGGIDPLEYRFYAMVDRVATTGTVWLGLSTGCAQCHTHKYDPITHTDYYRLMALLNNADEPDLIVSDRQIESRRTELESQLRKQELALAKKFPAKESREPESGVASEPTQEERQRNLRDQLSQWIKDRQTTRVDWEMIRPVHMDTNLPRLELMQDGSIFATGDTTKRDVYKLSFPASGREVTALRIEVLPDDRLPARGPGNAYYEGRKGDFFLSELSVTHLGKQMKFKNGSISFGKLSVGGGKVVAENVFDGEGSTGWSTSGGEGKRHELVLNFSAPWKATDMYEVELLFERHFVASLGRFRVSVARQSTDALASGLPEEICEILAAPRSDWSDAQRVRIRQEFLSTTPLLADERKSIQKLRSRMPSAPVTMVMRERPRDNPRKTYRHHRGEYLSAKEEVPPNLPSLFEGMGTATDRLTLARWLVSPQNPLVGRVTANRAWRAFFGAGLMRTSGDFGTQSDPPTHPQLLDWLAFEFTHGGSQISKPWSLKQLHRMIVTSRTYRQSSIVSRRALERDPDNRLLARGPRFRVDAETVRDIMLASSGLLSDKMYGVSVFPPQPASVTKLAYGGTKWNVSKGEDRYRRSLYTYSKRTAPFAAFTVFDGPTGENCLARRNRSNTPLQSLTMLNDAMFTELAQAMALSVLSKESGDDSGTAERLFRRLLTRSPTDAERKAMLTFYAAQTKRLDAGEINAKELLGNEAGTSVQAAWTLVARVLMNLDEAVTKQ